MTPPFYASEIEVRVLGFGNFFSGTPDTSEACTARRAGPTAETVVVSLSELMSGMLVKRSSEAEGRGRGGVGSDIYQVYEVRLELPHPSGVVHLGQATVATRFRPVITETSVRSASNSASVSGFSSFWRKADTRQ